MEVEMKEEPPLTRLLRGGEGGERKEEGETPFFAPILPRWGGSVLPGFGSKKKEKKEKREKERDSSVLVRGGKKKRGRGGQFL